MSHQVSRVFVGRAGPEPLGHVTGRLGVYGHVRAAGNGKIRLSRFGDRNAESLDYQPMTMFDSMTLRARSRSSPVSRM